jgi:uncharacterized membrane protein YeaQ/YmgE (transglycosylase-associated protein family)
MVLVVFVALIVIFVILPLVGAAIGWVVWTAVVGALLGGLARLIIPGRQNIGLLATIICGWVGSLIGGAIGSGVWGFHHNHHHIATLLIEVGVSAVAVLGWSSTHRTPVAGSKQHRIIDI